MGLFDFVKEAGQKLLGKDDDEAPAKQAPKSAPAAAPAEDGGRQDRRRAAGILEFVNGLDLGVSDLSVRVDGDTATVKGNVPDQSTREKVVLAVGNTQGIARVDDQLTVEAEEPAGTFYTVKRGDTLSAIAQAHYGSASQYPRIFEANKPMLTDPDKIYPGQVLRIPRQG